MQTVFKQGSFISLLFLFAYTAFSKLMNLENFTDVLWQAPLISWKAPVVAWSVPVIELIVVALLLWPSRRLLGLYAALVLILVFTAYILYMLIFSSHLPCLCGGVISTLPWGWHVALNSCFAVIAVAGIRAWKINPNDQTSKPEANNN